MTRDDFLRQLAGQHALIAGVRLALAGGHALTVITEDETIARAVTSLAPRFRSARAGEIVAEVGGGLYAVARPLTEEERSSAPGTWQELWDPIQQAGDPAYIEDVAPPSASDRGFWETEMRLSRDEIDDMVRIAKTAAFLAMQTRVEHLHLCTAYFYTAARMKRENHAGAA